jgi:hypothetical protein
MATGKWTHLDPPRDRAEFAPDGVAAADRNSFRYRIITPVKLREPAMMALRWVSLGSSMRALELQSYKRSRKHGESRIVHWFSTCTGAINLGALVRPGNWTAAIIRNSEWSSVRRDSTKSTPVVVIPYFV